MIINRQELISFDEKTGQKIRGKLLDILETTLQEADPYTLTLKKIATLDFSSYKKIYIVGAGKGTYRMALAVEKFLGKNITEGIINVPQKLKGDLKKININLAGHPLPTAGSLRGGKKILTVVKKAQKGDLILGLFSGGASALMSVPVEGISLADKIKTTQVLLRSGANIQELNAIRKHLSQIKGGRLAEAANGSTLISFYLSDVVGNDLSVIGSGPTAPDKTTFAKALEIIKKYNLFKKLPAPVISYLELGVKDEYKETPKTLGKNVINLIIGSHAILAKAAAEAAGQYGFKPVILTDTMQGITNEIGQSLIKKMHRDNQKNNLYIAAGETTFTVKTKKPGGRNQQMCLSVLPYLEQGDYFLAFDSDGVDGVGPEKVGGALIDYKTFVKAEKQDLDWKESVEQNDSYNFFKKIGGLIKTGYVGTNLGDLVLLVKTQ